MTDPFDEHGIGQAARRAAASPGQGRRTLVFCTAHVDDETEWDGRYRRWFDAVAVSGLDAAAALMVDDGSASLPDWADVAVLREPEGVVTPAPRVLYHFADNLGRKSLFDFPGWYRSFGFGAAFAAANGFDKVVHVESDAFVVSRRLADYLNAVDDGWVTLWCPRHGFPEITIQAMAGRGLDAYRAFCAGTPHAALAGRPYETQLPFTRVERAFVGDRYGEHLPYVPVEADYVAQAPEADASYYWWIPPAAAVAPPGGAESLRRHNEVLRYDRGRLQRMAAGLQGELAEMRRRNEDLQRRRDRSPAALARRLVARLSRGRDA